jgi:diphthine synthase
MGSFTFIGLGLNDEKGMTVEGLEEARHSDIAFAEFYTNIMPNLDIGRLESMIGKKIHIVDRTQVENEGGSRLLEASQAGRVAFLVPGDPMIATTHVSLRLSLSKIGIKTRIVHAASIMSAICGATGLQSYKFGKTVTVPYEEPLPKSVLDTISDNHDRGLHTLLLLDVKSGQDIQLTIWDAAARIMRADPKMQSVLAVGAARVGALDEKMKASKMRTLANEDFGGPPQSIVVVGKLHFVETEALRILWGAQDSDLRDSI